MKVVTASVRPHKLAEVLDALRALPHFPGVTVSECRGQGRGRGAGGHFELTEETLFLAPTMRLELACSDDICAELVEIIRRAAHTGNPGDGIIVVAELQRVIRIRSGQDQDEAL
jgi:nitrogen regulatory protein P-II 1